MSRIIRRRLCYLLGHFIEDDGVCSRCYADTYWDLDFPDTLPDRIRMVRWKLYGRIGRWLDWLRPCPWCDRRFCRRPDDHTHIPF